MEVNRLLSDELSYELRIRGCPVGTTVDQKRKALRQAFRLENEGACAAPSAVILNVEQELNICVTKLSSIEAEIQTFDYDNRKNEFERLYTRLLHVNLRLGRITPENDSQNRERVQLIATGRRLIGELNLAYDGLLLREPVVAGVSAPSECPVVVTSILDSPNLLIPEVVHSRTVLSPTRDSRDRDSQEVLIPNLGNDGIAGHEFVRVENAANSIRTTQESEPGLRQNCSSFPTAAQSSPVYQRRESRLSSFHAPTEQVYREVGPRENYSSVRFADSNPIRGAEDWSRVATDGQPSSQNQTLPSHGSTNLADRLAALNFSSVGPDNFSSYERARYMDPTRWNLKYDGISSVNNFLDRVEELRKSRGVTKPQLLRSAAELFTRDALLWFRTNDFSSWDDLVLQLRDAFQPYDYQNGIWEEIRRRTQGEYERVLIFIASMEQLFTRLSEKPSEESRVGLIRRNLLPYIQTQLSLRTVTTVRELVKACREIEETAIRVRRFCPPSTNYRQLLEPELAYHKPSNAIVPTINAVMSDRSTAESPSCDSVVTSGSEPRVPTCWNCRNTGHRFRECGQPRRIFCFKCGHDNVTTNRCPKCSKNLPMGRQ